MTQNQYRQLRNHLQLLACTVCKETPEYKNLCKRIQIIWDKIGNRYEWWGGQQKLKRLSIYHNTQPQAHTTPPISKKGG